jgi:hypothetical protein
MFNAGGGWYGGIIEMRAKFPNAHCLKSYVWLSLTDSNLKKRGHEYIDFVSFQDFNPNLIRSGLNFGKQIKFSGVWQFMTKDFTNVFNVFTMEWTEDYIYWKFNGKIYWKECINRYFEFENGTNYNKIREPFDGKYSIVFELRCDPINDDRQVDKNSWTNDYLFIDYIKIYHSSDSETHGSIENNFENLKNITVIAENGSELNDSAVIKYVITSFLVLLFMSIVLLCFVLYFIKKRTSITKSSDSAKNNDSDTTKRDDFRKSVDLYGDNIEHNYYAIGASQIGEDSQSFNNTYMELI